MAQFFGFRASARRYQKAAFRSLALPTVPVATSPQTASWITAHQNASQSYARNLQLIRNPEPIHLTAKRMVADCSWADWAAHGGRSYRRHRIFAQTAKRRIEKPRYCFRKARWTAYIPIGTAIIAPEPRANCRSMTGAMPTFAPTNPSTNPTAAPAATDQSNVLHASAHHIANARPKFGLIKFVSIAEDVLMLITHLTRIGLDRTYTALMNPPTEIIVKGGQIRTVRGKPNNPPPVNTGFAPSE